MDKHSQTSPRSTWSSPSFLDLQKPGEEWSVSQRLRTLTLKLQLRGLASTLPEAHHLSLEPSRAQLEEAGACCQQAWEKMRGGWSPSQPRADIGYCLGWWSWWLPSNSEYFMILFYEGWKHKWKERHGGSPFAWLKEGTASAGKAIQVSFLIILKIFFLIICKTLVLVTWLWALMLYSTVDQEVQNRQNIQNTLSLTLVICVPEVINGVPLL